MTTMMNNLNGVKMKPSMKKFYIILAAAFVAAACNKEITTPASIEGIIESPASVNPNAVPVKQITGVLDDNTKSGYYYDASEKALYTFWLRGDVIVVTDGESFSNYIADSDTEECTSTVFTGEGSFDLENGLWAIYPSSSVIDFTQNVGFDVKVYDSVEQDASGDFSHWSRYDLKSGRTIENGAEGVQTLQFNNLLSVLRVNLKLADNSIHFSSNETLNSIVVEAVNGESIAGTFRVSLSDYMTMTVQNGINKVFCSMPNGTTLSQSDRVSAYIPIAPGNVSQLRIRLECNKHTIVRVLNVPDGKFERNKFYDVNLTKITNGGNYTVTNHVGGWDGESPCTSSASTAGAVIALFDGIYDEQLAHRYYTVQLAGDENFNNIIETTNFQITYSSLYGPEGSDAYYLSDGKITFCGLNEDTDYWYRVKEMGQGDETYSYPAYFFHTKSRTSSSASSYRFIDFDDVKCYGFGDIMNKAVATFPGAQGVNEADEADWNDRLGFVSTSSLYNPALSACYRVGNQSYPGCALTSIEGVESMSYAFGRPGYIQLGSKYGTTYNHGSITVRPNWKDNSGAFHYVRIGARVRFKACPIGLDNVGKIKITVYGDCRGIDREFSDTVEINNDGNYSWVNIDKTLTDTGTAWFNGDNKITVTLATDSNTRVLIDNLEITLSS